MSVIDKQPTRIGSALDVIGLDAGLTRLLPNSLRECDQMTIARRGRDHKVIGEIGCFSNVQDDDFFRFRFGSPIGNLPC